MATDIQLIRENATYSNLTTPASGFHLQLYQCGIATDLDSYIYRSDDGFHIAMDSSSALTAGSIPFASGTGARCVQDNSTFFWDNSNKSLNIGYNSQISTESLGAISTNANQFLVGYNSSYYAMLNMSNSGVLSLRLSDYTNGDLYLFDQVIGGQSPELFIYGYRSGDAKRSLEIGVGIDAADTASFDGLSNYLFDGKLQSSQLEVEGTTGPQVRVAYDSGANDQLDITVDATGNVTLDADDGTLTLKTSCGGDNVIIEAAGNGDIVLTADDVYTEAFQSYSPSVTGWGGGETSNMYYKLVGKICFLNFYITGTSTTDTVIFDLPYTAKTATNCEWNKSIPYTNSGTVSATPGVAKIASGGTVCNVYRNFDNQVWTASGVKTIKGSIEYETA